MLTVDLTATKAQAPTGQEERSTFADQTPLTFLVGCEC